MAFNAETAQGGNVVPRFKFERVGDAMKITITDINDDIVLDDVDDKTKVVRGEAKFVAIAGTVIAARGGEVEDGTEGSIVTDTPTGEERSLLTQYQYRKAGASDFTKWPKPMTKAIGKAMADAKVSELAVGGILSIKFDALGDRNADNPSWNRPKFYVATYEPPAKSTSAFGDTDDF
jgi:hypothetical protein